MQNGLSEGCNGQNDTVLFTSSKQGDAYSQL